MAHRVARPAIRRRINGKPAKAASRFAYLRYPSSRHSATSSGPPQPHNLRLMQIRPAAYSKPIGEKPFAICRTAWSNGCIASRGRGTTVLKSYVRPGIDDRPDYDKALSKVAACLQKHRPNSRERRRHALPQPAALRRQLPASKPRFPTTPHHSSTCETP